MNWKQKFDEITSDSCTSETEKIESVLELGLDFLGLGIGIVSHVNSAVYKVMYASSPGNMIEPGATFEVGETYCCHTLKANDSVGFHHTGKSEIVSHPCYAHFKLESYLGAPISKGGKVIGTVNFSAAAPRDPFTKEEFRFIKELASWMGTH